jgi:hypothetical protein
MQINSWNFSLDITILHSLCIAAYWSHLYEWPMHTSHFQQVKNKEKKYILLSKPVFPFWASTIFYYFVFNPVMVHETLESFYSYCILGQWQNSIFRLVINSSPLLHLISHLLLHNSCVTDINDSLSSQQSAFISCCYFHLLMTFLLILISSWSCFKRIVYDWTTDKNS